MNIKELKWSESKVVNTRNGPRAVRTLSVIPPDFWKTWRFFKDELKEMGISVSKYQGNWVISLWSLPDETPQLENPVLETKSTIISSPNIALNGLEQKLLSYQIPHTKVLIQSMNNNRAAADASDTGTGKTYSALVVAKYLNKMPIIICPKSVITSWTKAMTHFGIEKYFVSNYEQYKFGNTKYLTVSDDKDKTMKWNVDNSESYIFIFDEAHRCKNFKTQNARMLVQAKQQNLHVMVLSATLADNPMQLYANGIAIGLFNNTSEFWEYVTSHGCEKNQWGGWEFNGTAKDILDIHNSIFPARGSRMRISDIPEFPDNLIMTECYNMNANAEKIRQIYEKMQTELNTLKEKKDKDVNPQHPLTITLRARQEVELLKVPTFIELIEDHIESGNSVAVFVNFNTTLESLIGKLKIHKIECSVIRGGQSQQERDDEIDRFQNGEVRAIISNIRAGGVGISLHDIDSKYPRVSLISPTWSAQDLKQVLGRIHRATGKTKSIQKIIFCADTVEEKVAQKVNNKLANINLINDGDIQDDLININGDYK